MMNISFVLMFGISFMRVRIIKMKKNLSLIWPVQEHDFGAS